MFKHTPTVKPSTPLRSSSRRQLLSILQLRYPPLKDAAPELLALLVPDGLKQCSAVSSAGIKLLLYSQPDRGKTTASPLWWEAGNDNGSWMNNKKIGCAAGPKDKLPEIMPTVYALWILPTLLPVLPTWPQVVDPSLLGGSALMVPGLLPPPHTYAATDLYATPPVENDLVAIVAYPSRVPQVVARMEMDVSSAADLRAGGEKGKAAKVLHSYKDGLWSLGSKESLPAEPEIVETAPATDAVDALTEQAAATTLADGQEDSASSSSTAAPATDTPPPPAAATFGTSEIDAILRLSLLSALQTLSSPSVEPLSLPVLASTFYSSHVLSHRPSHWPPRPAKGKRARQSKNKGSPGSYGSVLPSAAGEGEEQREMNVETVVVGKSSAKKFAKWVKGVEKEGLVRTKEQKGETVLVEICAGHPDVGSLTPYQTVGEWAEMKSAATLAEGGQEPDGAATCGAGGTGEEGERPSSTPGTTIVVEEAYVATAVGRPLFTAMGLPSSSEDYHQLAALRKALTSYIATHCEPVQRNQALVHPDALLVESLGLTSTTSTKESAASPALKREDLQRLFQQHCLQAYHRISRLFPSSVPSHSLSSPASSLLPGEASSPLLRGAPTPRIQLTLKRRQGNKVVTLIRGLETYYITPRYFAGEVRRGVGASISLSELPAAGSGGKEKREEVLVQGDQSAWLVGKLKRENGVGEACVEVVGLDGSKTAPGKGKKK